MKYVFATAAAALVLSGLPANAETRNFSGFTSVKAVDHIVVEVRNGPYAVEVSGPKPTASSPA